MEYYIELVLSIMVFCIGLMFGSFFTLATYRIPRKQDIVKTRSYCPNCKHKLGFFDCFPILSYVSTIGRCRYCKKPISIRYPLMELASGLVFLLIFLIFGFGTEFFILIALYVFTFLYIGVNVMSKKMTEEEREEVKKIKESKKKNNNRKKGALNSEILIAVVVFVLFFISTIYVTRNYSLTLIEYSRKSDALNLCVNKINEAKFTQFANLASSSGTEKVNNVDYTYSVNVADYVKNGTQVLDNAKVIDVSVSFNLNGKTNTVNLKSIKVNNI